MGRPFVSASSSGTLPASSAANDGPEKTRVVKNCARSVCTYHCEYEGERRGETRRRDSACPWDAPGQRQTQPRPRPENALLVSPDPLQETATTTTTTTTTTTRGAEKRTVAPQRRPPALVARIRGRPNAAVPARHARHEAYQHAYDSTMAQGRRRPSEGNGNTWPDVLVFSNIVLLPSATRPQGTRRLPST